MTRAATSILVFGVYVVIVGLTLILSPNTLLGLLGIAPTTAVYIRILGLVALAVGLYYCAAARQAAVQFFRWTLWGRGLVVVGLISFVALRLAPTVLATFGVIDALGATWTWFALRATRSPAV